MGDDADRYAMVAAALAGHPAIGEAATALLEIAPDRPHRGLLAAALIERLLDGDPATLVTLGRDIEALLAVAEAEPPPLTSWRGTRAMARATVLIAQAAVHDLPDVGAAVAEVDRLSAELTTDDVADDAPAGGVLRGLVDPLIEQLPTMIASGMPRAPVSANEIALGELHAGLRLLRPEAGPRRWDEGVDRLRAALAASRPDHPQRVQHLCLLGFGLLRRAEFTNDPVDLPEARRLALEAKSLLAGPQDGAFEMVHELLSQVRFRLGEGADSHIDKVESLRTHVWQVLMRADAAGAAAAARDASASAIAGAHSCIRANDVAGAVRALDAGRGLALYAATELRAVADRLRAAGHSGLAEEWEAASDGPGPSVALRRQVIGILADIVPDGALFDPPDTRQIRAALSELDLDALVYLVPATDGWPGLAVAVPARGRLAYLALPALRPADSPEVAAYLAAAKARDTARVGRGAHRDLLSLDRTFTSRLDVVCDWAWRAAMRPLVEGFLPTLRHKPSTRVPRLAFVPMGELALIPWQAARRAGGEPAVTSVALSQTASARMLCHSADLRPVPPSRLGMVIGDPDTAGAAATLLGARAEAYEIWGSFYRGGRYLGRLPDDRGISPSGAGTADEVRAWLTATGRAAGRMLHLACHGVVDTKGAYLLLADGRPLAAEELVTLMSGVPERDVGLVVLAACSTGLAAGDYDEAYSLGTAFLAAGARSVLSTQWTIPDAGTSLLMFMFHHYLMDERLPVWESLHRAQLWMLDPDRHVPDEMPDSLRRQLDDSGHDPANATEWAGFMHGGR
ncbi:CHAT domain-containing protein [Asanoa siamensis]|uniref:CHAT domain-containing protein n=1 Tax=Asanoa siamensis TaxID=926357 RepID=A0ABQ4CSG5_9ACTN|nr:CHAT domain-containing protein [Asanoa siamensis]GIF73792.1 hypothetical protein Asi02nite_33100 [Asanoa siamensis]